MHKSNLVKNLFEYITSTQKHLRIRKWILPCSSITGMNYRWISSALREDVNLINLPTICDIDWANHYFKLINKTQRAVLGDGKRKSFICKLLDGYWMLELLVFFFLGSSHKFLNYNNDYNQAFERMENQSSPSVIIIMSTRIRKNSLSHDDENYRKNHKIYARVTCTKFHYESVLGWLKK